MKTSVIEVRDMLSVLSVLGVEKRIGEVPGVESVTVNYAAGSATVRYDETRLEIADIKSHVRQSGYESAGEPLPKQVSEHNLARKHAVESAPETAPNSTSAPETAAPIGPAPAALAADENKVQATPDAKPATPAAAAPKDAPVAPAAIPAPAASAEGGQKDQTPPGAPPSTPVVAEPKPPPDAFAANPAPAPAAPPADEDKGQAEPGALGKVTAWVRDTFAGEDKGRAEPGAQTPTPAADVAKAAPGAAAVEPKDAPTAPAAGGHQGHAAAGGQAAMPSNMAYEMGHGGKDLPAMMRDMRNRFWICLIFTIPIFVYAPMGGFFEPPAPPFGLELNLWLFFFASAAILYPSWTFFVSAWRSLRKGTLSMAVLVVLSVGTGYLFSVGTTFFFKEGGQFFEAAAVLLVFILLGHWLEMRARAGATSAIARASQRTVRTDARVNVNSAGDRAAWWLRSLPTLLAELRASDPGLTHAEARARLKRYGLNQFRDRPERSLLSQFLRRFRNPLVLILIVASVVSAFTGEVASFVIIIVMVLLSVTLDFVQEYRAERSAQRLRQSVQLRASVLRDGVAKDVPVTQVVPGDVVLLAAGGLVPADGRLLEARDLHVNQALLTGEPFPVEKHAEELADRQADLEGATNALFMGTSVVSGTARLLVYRTGNATAIGEIAHTLNIDPPPTAFEVGTRHFGMLIMRLTVLMVLFVLMVNTVTNKPLLESFLFAIALAVGLTPELLPMVISVTLARGALRMAGKHVIVKRLAAIENLGSMDVLCTDKTGTLTEAKIDLERHVDVAGRDSGRVLELAYVNSFFETGIKSPLDEAILAHEHVDVSRWKKIDEAPFDFERRRVSVLVDDGAMRMLVVKGAPEDVLKVSTHYEPNDTSSGSAWDASARQGAQRQLDALGKDGLRVLGIAYKQVGKDHDHADVSDETELVFAGFAAFLDPPKASAAKALSALAASGVAVKILTGDNELVTQYICAKLGVPVIGVLTGGEIAQMNDLTLQARAGGANLFCRVNPAQKNRIILALKARGRVVGYLGDGINDAPALHSADVSLSVDTAVDVAKAAADLILLKHDLQVLQDGVLEGRRTFANIRKYILMGTSSNFGNMFSMAGASLFLPFLPMLPTQILLNNVLYDLSEIAIPLDHVDSEEIHGPQGWDMRFIRNFMWIIGPVSSLFDFLTFYVLLAVLKADEVLFQTGWFIESLATQVLVIFVIRTRRNPFSSRPHVALAATSLAVVLAALVLPFTALGRFFGFEPPPAKFFAILAIMVVAYLGIVEAAKRVFYAHFATKSR